MQLLPVSRQTIVITGASSGIGLATARRAAARGAKLVLTSRNEAALAHLASELAAARQEAIYVVADVADREAVHRVAKTAIDHFGGFDTWVNNAGVSIYGRLQDVPMEDARRLFETNFWGVVHGSLVALEHLRRRGGAILNIGSVVSDRAIPLQGMYSASKHAVKGFTDTLRMEVEKDGFPVSVTLIKPAAIDTPYLSHARNYMPEAPRMPPPVYPPELVAEAILHCAETPTRDMIVGGAGKVLSTMAVLAPRLLDKFMEYSFFHLQKKPRGSQPTAADALEQAGPDLKERGDPKDRGEDQAAFSSGLYQKAMRHPALTGALLAGVGLALASAGKRSD